MQGTDFPDETAKVAEGLVNLSSLTPMWKKWDAYLLVSKRKVA